MAYDMGNFVADFNYMLSFAASDSKTQLSNWFGKYLGGKYSPTTTTLNIAPPAKVNRGKGNGDYEDYKSVKNRVQGGFNSLVAKFVPLNNKPELVGSTESLSSIISSASFQTQLLPGWRTTK